MRHYPHRRRAAVENLVASSALRLRLHGRETAPAHLKTRLWSRRPVSSAPPILDGVVDEVVVLVVLVVLVVVLVALDTSGC